MKRYFAYCLSVLFLAVPLAADAATVTPGTGQVLVNTGDGFEAVSGPTTVGPGDTVMVYPGGSATISYGGGCSVSVEPGGVVSVSERPPCSATREEIPHEAGSHPHDYTLALASVAGVAGVVAIVVAGSDGVGPVSP